MKKSDKVIMYDSEEAAKPHTMQGWLSSKGFFFKEENGARYDGCTHRPCEICNEPAEKMYSKCESCRHKSKVDNYNAREFESWDGVKPIYSESFDKYYFDQDDLIYDIEESMEENEGLIPVMMLRICEPQKYGFIGADYWENELPEEGDIEDGLKEKINELNAYIKTLHPASWAPGKKRTSYDYVASSEGDERSVATSAE